LTPACGARSLQRVPGASAASRPRDVQSLGAGRPGTSHGGSLPIPASQAGPEGVHGILAGGDLPLMRARSAALVPFDRTHPGSVIRSTGVGFEDAPDVAISLEDVVVVRTPVAGALTLSAAKEEGHEDSGQSGDGEYLSRNFWPGGLSPLRSPLAGASPWSSSATSSCRFRLPPAAS
jgi:hypothetical protein